MSTPEQPKPTAPEATETKTEVKAEVVAAKPTEVAPAKPVEAVASPETPKVTATTETKPVETVATIEAKPVEAVAPPETPKAVATTEAKPVAGDKKKVLIVEDTIELAEVLEATLQRMGIDTKHETHATKAMDIFKTYEPDLVLLDIGLPDMSGWKFLDSIKENDKGKRPHFIIITAYGDPANRLMGKLQDVDSYLIKPFSPDEVERVVGKVLGMVESV